MEHPFPNEPERSIYEQAKADAQRRVNASLFSLFDVLLTRIERLKKDLR